MRTWRFLASISKLYKHQLSKAKQYQNLNYLLIIPCSTENTFYTGMHICYLYNYKMKKKAFKAFYFLIHILYFI